MRPDPGLQTALTDGEAPLLVTHIHADRDTLGSALGLQALLGRGTICTPDGVAKRAQSLLEITETTPVTEPALEAFDPVVVLDSPSSDRIAPVDPVAPILIDHHEPDDLMDRAQWSFVDTDAGATAELVARLAQTADWELSPAAALPLVVGILDDTGFLAGAGPHTTQIAVELIGALGDRGSDLPPLLDRSRPDDERLAEAIGVLRATGYRAGDLIIGITQVGGHESAAATALRGSGVDLAVVCAEQGDHLRVTVRASDRFTQHLNVGATLLPALADQFGGDGGGHAEAGVAHLDSATPSGLEATLIERIEAEVGMTFSQIGR